MTPYQGHELLVWLLLDHLADGLFARLLHRQVTFSPFSVPLGRSTEPSTRWGLGRSIYIHYLEFFPRRQEVGPLSLAQLAWKF